MSDGYHGRWCGSRTWPTKCPTCSAAVFFFTCGCGCKVFFEFLGKPWPLHWCTATSTAPALPTEIEVVATSADEASQRFRDRIEERVAERAKSTQRTSDPIVAVAPKRGAARDLVGALRELTLDVDAFKTFRLDKNSMAAALLGKLGRGPLAKITVHVPAADADEIESYTVWLPRTAATILVGKRGAPVCLVMQMEKAASDHVWWTERVELLSPQAGRAAASQARATPPVVTAKEVEARIDYDAGSPPEAGTEANA